jgi:hypothetical protein
VSSGSYATKAGFREDFKPSRPRGCASVADEPRGPHVYFTGLCRTCGIATTMRDAAGQPRHAPFRQPVAFEVAGSYPAPGVYLATAADADTIRRATGHAELAESPS